MIIFDFTQMAIATTIEVLGPKVNNPDLIRHVCLNTIRANVVKFRPKYGKEIILACDNRDYWRKDIFPFYKKHRAEDRAKSETDWNLLFNALNTLKAEFKQFLPYHVIEVDKAEADDIIAVLVDDLCRTHPGDDPILIISGDKDFQQLQSWSRVGMYSPSLRKMVTCPDPEKFLWEHIMTGDKGDGIPNVLTQDDAIYMKVRQQVMTAARLENLLNAYWHKTEFDKTGKDRVAERVERNRNLIDFSRIPQHVRDAIIEAKMKNVPATRRDMISYFVAKDLRNLIDVASDF